MAWHVDVLGIVQKFDVIWCSSHSFPRLGILEDLIRLVLTPLVSVKAVTHTLPSHLYSLHANCPLPPPNNNL